MTEHDLEPRGRRRVAAVAGALLLAVVGASTAASAPKEAPRKEVPRKEAPRKDVVKEAPAEEAGAEPTGFLRIDAVDGDHVALEIASRRYRRAEGDGPVVSLVGVAHIGDRGYYRAVQELLADHDVVLYESVKPSGTGGAGGDTDSARIESTRAAVGFVASVVELHHERGDGYPADLDAARAFAEAQDPRLGAFLEAARTDAWGRELAYLQEADDGRRYRLLSYGADGRPGGTGADADIVAPAGATALPIAADSGDRLQAQLADALSLSFQLDALEYGGPNWRCSDMSMDQIDRAMRDRGADFTLVEGTLAGTTLPAQLARFLLGVVRMADMFTGGAVSDMLKVLLIEMLGDEALIEHSLRQFDEGFTEVIIVDRNRVVIEDLRELAAAEPDVRSVAVLYGAGHMRDLATRLETELGYRPESVRWLRAIEVDLAESAASEAEIRQLRLMVRRMMRQMTAR